MSKKISKKKIHPIAIFAITLITVLSIGCGVLLFLYSTQEKEAVHLVEQEVTTSQENQETTATTLVDTMMSEAEQAASQIPEEELDESEEEKELVAEVEPLRDVTLAFVGDILLDDNYSMMVTLKNRDGGIYGCISEDLMKEMQAADIFMLNNEFTFTDRGEPLAEKKFTFRAKPENVSILNEMGVDIVSLANNHAYDYGEISLLDTLDTLENAGILYAGAGRNIEEAAAPVYYEIGGMKIGFVAATQIERLDNPDTKEATETTPGVFRCWNPEKMLEVVEQTKQNCDFVVVYIHWGAENTVELDWAQRDQAVQLAEAGADLIIGDHPHCLQPIDYVGDVPVIYSLGNFWFNSKTVDTCLVKGVVNAEGLQTLQFVPALQSGCSTKMLYGAEKERVLTYMRTISTNINIDEEGYIASK